MDDCGGVSRRALLLGGLGALAAVGAAGTAVEWDNPHFVRLRGGCGDTPAIPATDYTVSTGELRSPAMHATLPWSVARPPGQQHGDGTPLLLCLPGRGSDAGSVMNGIGIPGFATAGNHGLVIAAPGGGDSTYWHPRADGSDPLRYLVEEFIPYVENRFGCGGSRDKRATLGWSMGGFGALLVAQQHPGFVGAAVGMSPAVFPSYDAARAGHSYTFDSATDWEQYGLWNHLDDLRSTPVLIECGGADPFAPTARQLLSRVPGAQGGIGSGCHDTGFWRRTAPAALRFVASHVRPAT